MSLSTVGDYIARTRTLLQDTVAPFRYPDADLVEALNMAWLEASRVRPDLPLDVKYKTRVARVQSPYAVTPPVFTVADTAASAQAPAPYSMAFLYFVVGQAQLRDTEDTQDGRASAFINKFTAQLQSTMA
jgi:hypothetical protein